MKQNDWKSALPTLTGRLTTLREPVGEDLGPLLDLLSLADATRFGMEEPVHELAVRDLIDRSAHDRAGGLAFTYAVTSGAGSAPVGLVQVRQLDPGFEVAEWECTLAPSVRGSGMFLDLAALVASFTFGPVGARRLEARVPLQNGRGNAALRKLGAVQEGILRRSFRRGGDYVDQALWSLLRDDWHQHLAAAGPRVH